VLDAIDWGSDGWPTINSGHGPSGGLLPGNAAAAQKPFVDDFRCPILDPEWKWPIGHAPIFHVGNGRLVLEVSADETPVFLGRSLMASAYVAILGVDPRGGAEGGLGLIGNAENRLTLSIQGKRLEISRVTGKAREALWQTDLGTAGVVWLRVSSAGNAEATFSYSLDQNQWTTAKAAVSLAGLPPWDQGLRVGLVSKGPKGTRASFVHFSLDAKN
jgi:hypothetical protein